MIILIIGVTGMAFSGYLSYREFTTPALTSCVLTNAPGTIWGYPACVYGLVMYTLIVGVTLWTLFGRPSGKT